MIRHRSARRFHAALLVSVLALLGAAGCAETAAGQNQSTTSADETTGDEYAAQIGLTPIAWSPDHDIQQGAAGLTIDGKLVAGCEASDERTEAFTVLPNDHLYCYSSTDPFEVWLIGQRLGGHEPTESEMGEMRAQLAG